MVATATAAQVRGQITPAHRQPSQEISVNVGPWERVASGVGGALLALRGLDTGGFLGIGMIGVGAALVYRGVTGNCSMYRSLGISSAETDEDAFKGVKFESSVTINKSRDEVYRAYRNFSQHPRFSETVKAVEPRTHGRTMWTVEILGQKIQWEAEIIADRPGEMCSWRSTEDSDVRTAGSVHFDTAPGGRGTEVSLSMSFEPPLGPVGRAMGRALRTLPSSWADNELRRFKQWLETGSATA